jgi:hypothetical protein
MTLTFRDSWGSGLVLVALLVTGRAASEEARQALPPAASAERAPPPAPSSTPAGRCDIPPPGAASGASEAPPPPVKGFDAWGHFMVGLHFGVAGDVDRDGTKSPLDPSFGLNLRGDVAIARYVLIGPFVQFGAWHPDPSPSRNYYVDFDFFLRARIPITTASTNFQFWAGVPIGLTLSVLGQGVDDASSGGVGWNVGALLGGAMHFTPKVGAFAELGWLRHAMSHRGYVGQDLDFRMAQWILNVGFVLRN